MKKLQKQKKLFYIRQDRKIRKRNLDKTPIILGKTNIVGVLH